MSGTFTFLWESAVHPQLSRAWYRQWLLQAPSPQGQDEENDWYRVRRFAWESNDERERELQRLSSNASPAHLRVALLIGAEKALDAGDLNRAVSLLAAAKKAFDESERGAQGVTDQHRMLVARVHHLRGDNETAKRELSSVIADTPFAAQRAAAQEHLLAVLRCSTTPSEREQKEIVAAERECELLYEELALLLPKEDRKDFWDAPGRRPWRPKGDKQRADFSFAGPHADATTPTHAHGAATMWRELVEITKTLLATHERTPLLSRITTGAIELTRAERGFLILRNANGALEVVARSDHGDRTPASFSLSIAESVLIDGAPLITAAAQQDPRLSSFMSVHQMALQSVACVPIRGANHVLGVFYIEHRGFSARFAEEHIDVLLAFADLAALTLSLRDLQDMDAEQKRALQESNESLERAKQDIEVLLAKKSDELENVQRRLAQTSRKGHAERYGIVAESPAMEQVLDMVERVQNIAIPVVIRGDSGTGKEIVARAIHDGGNRAQKPFVAINCAAIPENLLEAELFGYRRGSFTGAEKDRVGIFEKANGGTLFLDEIADMPERMQVALLRVLAEGKVHPLGADNEVVVNPRILCATQKDLRVLVQQGRFREDLFYRLSVVEIVLPPLVERRRDILRLADHFLQRISRKENRRKTLSREAAQKLETYAWPGNVRELEHVITRAFVMSDSEISVGDLQLQSDLSPAPRASPLDESVSPDTQVAWKEHEKAQILDALARTRWNRARAAKELGMPRRTFYRRLKEFDILIAGDDEENDG